MTNLDHQQLDYVWQEKSHLNVIMKKWTKQKKKMNNFAENIEKNFLGDKHQIKNREKHVTNYIFNTKTLILYYFYSSQIFLRAISL